MVVLIVMGVCGCGKTTVAQKLAAKLNCSFRDADEFHSEENKRKMNQGIALTDQDRGPWLCAIHCHIKSLIDVSQTSVLTCSALKKSYRQILLSGHQNRECSTTDETRSDDGPFKAENVLFIYLKGEREVIEKRLLNRLGHFMSPTLLDSQLKTLEEPQEPERYIRVNVEHSVDKVVTCILDYLNTLL